MLADVFFDAHATMQHPQHEFPDLYVPFACQREALPHQLVV
jgi:hypothetical protein